MNVLLSLAAMFLQVKGRIDARNSLETYCYNMKSTIEDKLGDKVSDEQKETVGFTPDMDFSACMLPHDRS